MPRPRLFVNSTDRTTGCLPLPSLSLSVVLDNNPSQCVNLQVGCPRFFQTGRPAASIPAGLPSEESKIRGRCCRVRQPPLPRQHELRSRLRAGCVKLEVMQRTTETEDTRGRAFRESLVKTAFICTGKVLLCSSAKAKMVFPLWCSPAFASRAHRPSPHCEKNMHPMST